MNALPESLKDHRVRMDPQRSVTYGDVAWEPVRSLWFIAMTLGAVVGGALNFSWSDIALFLVSTAAVLLFGRSLGMPSRRELFCFYRDLTGRARGGDAAPTRARTRFL